MIIIIMIRYGCAAAAVGGKLYVVGGHDGKKASVVECSMV